MTAFTIGDVNSTLLGNWPLPKDRPGADKEERGHILVVAGSREMPGAAILASTAALRAGAGKLTIATAASVAVAVATAFPEARVIGLPETTAGGFSKRGAGLLEKCTSQASAGLIGPGMMDEKGSMPFVFSLLAFLADKPVVLDAAGMGILKTDTPVGKNVLLTPHAGEMCHLTGLGQDEILGSAAAAAFRFAQAKKVFVTLKGASTYIASPFEKSVWRHHAELPGLGTSGSGDVLAGIIAGIAARGAQLDHAAVWGVAIHARAGAILGKGGTGFLARELADAIPGAAASCTQGVG